jgi:signal transduction histidine kinase
LIFLETDRVDIIPDEVISFLSRLSDHAAIAISNAQLYAAIENANLAKSEFVSFVSHELKTPMTSIKGFTDLLAAGVVGPVNETQANFLSTIRSNVDRMATLVSDLADVSRIEAGRLRLEYGAIPVTNIVEEVVRSVRKQIEEKQQLLSLEIDSPLPSMWGDRTRLIQILTNLLSNAHKYSPVGGKITLCAEIAENHWAAGAPCSNGGSKETPGGPKVIHLFVQDTGFGILPADQNKIFQKFFRSEDQNVRDTPGTGLGLNITKTLVEMQGGAIWFISEYRKGTTFHFTIPIAETA